MTRTVVACAGFLPLLFLVELESERWLFMAVVSLLIFAALSFAQGCGKFDKCSDKNSEKYTNQASDKNSEKYTNQASDKKRSNARLNKRNLVLCRLRTLYGLLIVLFLSISYSTWRASLVLDQRLPSVCHGSVLTVDATISSDVRKQQAKNSQSKQVIRYKFDVTINAILEASLTKGCSIDKLPGRVIVSRYLNNAVHTDDSTSMPELRYGDRIAAVLQLREVRGLSAPGAFDQEKYALSQRISAYGTIKELQLAKRRLDQQSELSRISTIDSTIRSKLINLFDQHFSSYSNAGVFAAVMFGDKVKLSTAQKNLFLATGTTHLMAVSGLHIGLCMLLAKALAQTLASIISPKALQLFETFLAISAGLAYLAVAGWPISGQRAFLMLSAWLLCGLFMRNSNRYAIFMSAALIILAIDPLAVFDGGFWLSFFAVYILISLGAGMLGASKPETSDSAKAGILSNRILKYLSMLIVLQLALCISLPFLLGALGMPFYPITFLANLVAVPIYSVLLIPAILLSLVSLSLSLVFGEFSLLGTCFIQVARTLLDLVDSCITFSNSLLNTLQIVGSDLSIDLSHPIWFAPMIVLLLTGVLTGRNYPAFSAQLVLLIVLFGYGTNNYASNIHLNASDLLITQIDVGQGSAYLVQTHEQSWLYDAGPSFLFGGDAARSAILPALRYAGISSLSGLIISHGDDDHAGGASTLLNSVTVNKIFVPSAQKDLISIRAGQSMHQFSSYAKQLNTEKLQPRILDCVALNSIPTLGSPFAMRTLWPSRADNGKSSFDDSRAILNDMTAQSVTGDNIRQSANNSSCVIQIYRREANDRALLLLTGDIDASVEKRLVEKNRATLESEILVVAHHGSLSSSAHTFLDATAPDVALISAGHGNRYRHPHPEVIRRLSLRKIATYASASHGTVQWLYKSDEEQWYGPFCSRAEKRHFWQLNNNAEGCVGGLR